VMESAGQDQALRRVSWVARPDHTYRAICTDIFELSGDRLVPENNDQQPEGAPEARARNRYAGFVTAAHGADTTDNSRGIHTRPAEPRDDGDAWPPGSTSPTDIHEADTGPISY
jgi:hypothetical protein